LSGVDLDKLGFAKGGRGRFEFESGIVLEGVLEGEPLRHGGEILFMSFRDCRITWGQEVLYQPEWGAFDLACGDQVASVFGGAADRAAYTRSVGQGKIPKKIQKRALSPENLALNELYSQVRKLREEKVANAALEKELSRILSELDSKFPGDWLLRLEIVELDQERGLHSAFAVGAKKALEGLAAQSQEKRELISRGLALLGGEAS
jgi:phenylalanine-4-hydroxylase